MPAPAVLDVPQVDETTAEDRPWVVIVWNDPINLMSYVTFVLQKLFGYDLEKATSLMLDVHQKGKAVVASGSREQSELHVFRLHEHGLWATLEHDEQLVIGTPKIVTRSGDRFTLHVGADERAVVARLLQELGAMQDDPDASDATTRLFPVVHPADPAAEEEWQRLMRNELVRSRAAAIDTVVGVLERPGRKVPLDEAELYAFMQAVNSVRLVLGTVLDVGEDPEEVAPELLESPEYGLYGYLSFVLDAAVRAMSGR